ncbi:MAG TPA: PCRF domain-containing protein, partial [Candidatus Saccharimonadaceae bacterium]|nr:PCRF domain-containing protein [Candidatus Saccharimonadaceae bacterium]
MPKINLSLTDLTTEYRELGDFLARPDAFSDPEFSSKNKRFTELETLIAMAKKRDQLVKNIGEARELANGSDELAELAKEDLQSSETELETLENDLFVMLAPRDPNDDRNVIVEIRAGAGGDEASLFAAELYRMYLRWCEAHGLKTELISESPNDAGGYKEVIFSVKGDSPYSQLKFESGVHRVQRV